ncbi:putative aminopeptidase W07G4.4 [Trichinella britovi]|uniref:Putative aminopeptidase W07G4.4 n=1 Tax=Trichinella britovi TaxID=45882 RepID=A0A0V1CYP0_TRIBR|nr:putative aminopeptidase W07G4.4 [Trichinella britovi]
MGRVNQCLKSSIIDHPIVPATCKIALFQFCCCNISPPAQCSVVLLRTRKKPKASLKMMDPKSPMFFTNAAMPELMISKDVADKSYDAVMLTVADLKFLPKQLQFLKVYVDSFVQIDQSALKALQTSIIPIPKTDIPSGRLAMVLFSKKTDFQILNAVGPVSRDYDDERRFRDAIEAGMKKALAAGVESILLICCPHPNYPTAELVTILAALQALYTPLELRELNSTNNKQKVKKLGIWCPADAGATTKCVEMIKVATAIECGRTVARDIGGSDPERMCPLNAAEYTTKLFQNSHVHVTVELGTEYPLLQAVNRAADKIPRHRAKIVKLEYVGQGPIEETVLLVGKGVTLDTGGLNIKIGSAMNGMSRDKCGAAAVIGFFQALEQLQPKGLKAIGSAVFVRNSVGPESFSCDEILTSRSGKRIRIINTDAEGRMIMLDPLCEMKERAIGEMNPHIYTIATLTGHAGLTVGYGYNIAVCNKPAEMAREDKKLQNAGKAVADMFEISRLRREDFEANRGDSEYEDMKQSNTEPSVRTPRGHTVPAAFLIEGSGLDKHGADSDQPIKYTHIDMASGNGPFPGTPWGSPVAALVARYVIHSYQSTEKL